MAWRRTENAGAPLGMRGHCGDDSRARGGVRGASNRPTTMPKSGLADSCPPCRSMYIHTTHVVLAQVLAAAPGMPCNTLLKQRNLDRTWRKKTMIRNVAVIMSSLVTVAMFAPVSSAMAHSSLANPASVYCEQQGGQLEIRTDPDGGQYGVCTFADSSECEEWAFYRGECQPGEHAAGLANPASVYCAQQGGKLEIRADDAEGQVGICVFDDGSECEEWSFYRGECKPDQYAAETGSQVRAARPLGGSRE